MHFLQKLNESKSLLIKISIALKTSLQRGFFYLNRIYLNGCVKVKE